MKTYRKKIRELIFFFVTPFILLHTGLEAKGQDFVADSSITRFVREELVRNKAIPVMYIDVKTSDGIVTLSGKVTSILAKENAEKIVKAVKGVRGVINRISVETVKKDNQQLWQDVKNALLYDPATEAFEINVLVNNGEVTLEGKVESLQEKKLAGYVVKGVRGVTNLVNNLNINYIQNRSDIEIKNDIVQTLRNDVRVDGELIQVEVKNGKVFLKGTVGSATEIDQATADAWVAGVSSVDAAGLNVEAWARDERMRKNKYVLRTDDDVHQAIKETLLYDPRVNALTIQPSVENGIVTLNGTVSSAKAKKSAEEDVRNVIGVRSVINRLQISTSLKPTDADIKRNIEMAFQRDPYIENFEISVKVNDGIATLSGMVDNLYEKSHAADVADRASGVLLVENNILIDGGVDINYPMGSEDWNTFIAPEIVDLSEQQKEDREIKNQIENRLWWSPFVNQDEVNVIVLNGTAILSGTVDTEREKMYAQRNAFQGGAIKVQNKLSVKSGEE